jgi:hypothetical protein
MPNSAASVAIRSADEAVSLKAESGAMWPGQRTMKGMRWPASLTRLRAVLRDILVGSELGTARALAHQYYLLNAGNGSRRLGCRKELEELVVRRLRIELVHHRHRYPELEGARPAVPPFSEIKVMKPR